MATAHAPELYLTPEERAMLDGERGAATATAMEVIVAMAAVAGADRLVEITSAHVDSCLYHGTVGLDFAERLAANGGRVRVPTTLNVASLDLLHPELVRLQPETRSRARRLMDAYVAMGGSPTWTCAPYQLPGRPRLGEHVAWAESNAIVFANSVLGARTGRYGDFMDVSAALTGRVPYAGLHRPELRRAQVVFEVAPLPDEAYRHDELFAVLGHVVGRRTASLVPAIAGLPAGVGEDALKALGAAAASSGAVGLCHVVGVTPEAPTLEATLGGVEPVRRETVARADLRNGWTDLSTAGSGERLDAVSLGTPHFSVSEFERLVELLDGRHVHPDVTLYVSTGRGVLAEVEHRGLLPRLADERVRLVTDTCTYVTSILAPGTRRVMTNSAKWAWYAPANLGVDVAFGTMADCVRSAVAGKVVRERPGWLDG